MMTQEEKKQRADARKEARRSARRRAEIEEAKNQKPVESIVISIEWIRSRTWGHNPAATADVTFKDGTFLRTKPYRCSGCGYDKESTVVAQVFNAFLKYKLYLPEIEIKVDKAPYGARFRSYGNPEEEYRGYEGAIGMSCYPSISKFIGGELHHVASGKMFDVWRYVDKEQQT